MKEWWQVLHGRNRKIELCGRGSNLFTLAWSVCALGELVALLPAEDQVNILRVAAWVGSRQPFWGCAVWLE